MDREIAKERLIIFQKFADKIKIKYKKSLFEKKTSVLFENKVGDNEFFGKDEYSNSVIVKSNVNLNGKIKKVLITNGNQNTLFGNILNGLDKKDFAA